ncbi:MAG: efflux RND transporter periplasmic adaptor subunit [Raineya sp.]|jgi:membrane fusion protein (multidrug efflux system)|nr:efflux RND transporter periplasmic adaptor subunit [Raineya sp.]
MKFISYSLIAYTLFLYSCSSGNGKGKEVSNNNAPKKEPPVPVEAIIATEVDFTSPLEVSGSLQSQDFVEIRPEASGKIVALSVPEGNFVGQGTVLGRLYSADLQAQLKKNEAQLTLAKKNEERLKKLLEVGGVNQQEYDQVLSQVQSLQADIEFVQAQIRKTVITAPFSGKLGLRQVSLGAYVSPNNVVVTLQNTNIQVDFNVPEQYIQKVKIGEKVSLKVEGTENLLNAQIIAIEPQISATTRNLKVRARVEGSTEGVLGGMFARVFVGTAQTQKAILVPSNAIIPETRGKKVAVIRGGKPIFTDVETGARKEAKVQILKGLKVGDTVATTGILFLKPTSQVVVKKVIQ